MLLFMDVEFNSYQGELISIAIVSEEGHEWYEVLGCENPHPWVAEHVMPILDREPIASKELLSKSMEKFLAQFPIIHLIADFPDDIRHFCDLMVTGPGERINTPPLFIQIIRDDCESKRPHNALDDARGIRDFYLSQRKGS